MRRAHLLVVVICCALITACTTKPTSVETPINEPPATAVATALAKALTTGDLTGLPVAAPGLDAATKDYATILSGMDGLLPTVTAGKVTYTHDGRATVPLKQVWPVGTQQWTYDSTASLTLVNGSWQVAWAPTVVNPDLTPGTRLRHTRDVPQRGSITGAGGRALVEESDVVKVGIDKSKLDKTKWESSAKQLAGLVQVDEASYVKAVLAAGDQAYVVAITLRPADVPPTVDSVPGYQGTPAKAQIAISKTFARAIIGTMGTATPDQIKASHGAIQDGDLVGLSGLQRRYQAQLAGTVGQTITQVARKASASASPSAASSTPFTDVTLFTIESSPGKPLATTLDIDQQQKAEAAVAQASGVAAMVVVHPSTGEIIAAANGPATNENPDATFGRYPPGSTFKVVTSLALLRAGLSPDTKVPCTATLTVNGRTFKNYNDFPSDKVGDISLTDALANSCNTAFISQAGKVKPADLASAAASLGLGVDYDAGYPSFFGSVPNSDDPVVGAADMIGQGQVEASPMAMAGVAASVAAGHTTVPYLLPSAKPVAKGAPLTATEAQQLQAMMTAVVTSGSGRVLAGQMTGAKTGTAEFGNDSPPKTHAWMIAWNGDIAIAVLVAEGESGSKTAAPLIQAFLG